MTDGNSRDGVVPLHAVKHGAAGNKRWRSANRPKGPFIWLTQELIESAAWAAMPLAARRVVERVAIEHMKHGGTRNGRLIVTYDDFAEFGVRRPSIGDAIKTAVTLGFIDVTVQGRRSHGIGRRDNVAAAVRRDAGHQPVAPLAEQGRDRAGSHPKY